MDRARLQAAAWQDVVDGIFTESNGGLRALLIKGSPCADAVAKSLKVYGTDHYLAQEMTVLPRISGGKT